MPQPAPAEIADLLGATDPATCDAAWSRFLERHSGLLFHAARSFGSSYDEAMDRYRYMVEEFARDDYRRLRAFSPDGPGKFSTWLVVVAQRLCRDYHRKRYGRLRTSGEESTAAHTRTVRWRLEELVAEELDPTVTSDSQTEDPELSIRRKELGAALALVLDGLEPSDRLLLRYRFEDDRSLAEIAALMHSPSVFHVFRRIRGLMGKLRLQLRRRGVDGPAP